MLPIKQPKFEVYSLRIIQKKPIGPVKSVEIISNGVFAKVDLSSQRLKLNNSYFLSFFLYLPPFLSLSLSLSLRLLLSLSPSPSLFVSFSLSLYVPLPLSPSLLLSLSFPLSLSPPLSPLLAVTGCVCCRDKAGRNCIPSHRRRLTSEKISFIRPLTDL